MEMNLSENINCICEANSGVVNSSYLIQCDVCKDWFHGRCVSIREYQTMDIDKYHCPRCEPLCGPSIFKTMRNWHRHDYSEAEADCRPVQTGTMVFLKELRSRHFPSGDEIVIRLRGQQLTLPYLHQNGFNNPILVEELDGLQLLVPPDNFTVTDVENYVGSERELDVIDVHRQRSVRMSMHEFTEYFTNPTRLSVLNCVSLEFSDASLSALVEPPYIVRKLCWVENVWPRVPLEGIPLDRPKVQKYCIMSAQESYTDFHVDFGGTSVWYHILRGEKIFYLIPPTPANLALYQRWCRSSTMSDTFFGDQVATCYRSVLRQGHTLFIPTGWIHAVYTPVDSLVFGGNFLHSLGIPLQLQIYEIEKITRTHQKFCFPYFETLHWFMLKKLVQDLHDINTNNSRCPSHFLEGTKAFLNTLRQWSQDKEARHRKEPIPEILNPPKLLKELAKEIRHAERYLTNLNPPKPERESLRRRKKKPLHQDFIDISAPHSLQLEPLKPANKCKVLMPESPLKMTLSKHMEFPVQSVNEFRIKMDPEEKQSPPSKGSLVMREDESKPPGLKLKLWRSDGQNMLDSSVYDFHDSDEGEGKLTIDEKPQVKKSNASLKLRLSRRKSIDGSDINEKLLTTEPKNGIAELLRASNYTDQITDGPEPPHLDALESGRASPSTREAIAGMLSIGRAFLAGGSSMGHSSLVAGRGGKKRRYNYTSDEDMKQVFEDEMYVYPTLDASDEEEGHVFKPRGKGKLIRDEAWSPRARVSLPLSRKDRPVREGTKREAIERGLETAASKVLLSQPTKRHYVRRKPKMVMPELGQSLSPQPGPSHMPMTSKQTPPLHHPSFSAPPPPPPPAAPVTPVVRRPKKGMATVKQRLGKILKLHKMLY